MKDNPKDFWHIFWWLTTIDTFTLRRKFPVWEIYKYIFILFFADINKKERKSSVWERFTCCGIYCCDSPPRLLLATMVTIKKIFNARFGKTTKILSKGIELPQNLYYWEKLKYLNLYSLERRRENNSQHQSNKVTQ